MSEENINEVLGVENSQSVEDTTSHAEVSHTASSRVSTASTICMLFGGLCLVMAVIGAIIYLSENVDIDYDYPTYNYNSAKIEAMQWKSMGGSCFIYGIIGAISCYISSAFLDGISVISKAAEIYLSKNQHN